MSAGVFFHQHPSSPSGNGEIAGRAKLANTAPRPKQPQTDTLERRPLINHYWWTPIENRWLQRCLAERRWRREAPLPIRPKTDFLHQLLSCRQNSAPAGDGSP